MALLAVSTAACGGTPSSAVAAETTNTPEEPLDLTGLTGSSCLGRRSVIVLLGSFFSGSPLPCRSVSGGSIFTGSTGLLSRCVFFVHYEPRFLRYGAGGKTYTTAIGHKE